MKSTKLLLGLLAICSMLFIWSCDDDGGEAPALTVTSLNAAGTDLMTGQQVTKDLNAATSAEDVPVDAVFTVGLSGDVNPTSATAANVTLSSAAGNVPVTVSGSGSSITITPQEELSRGTDYTLTLSGNIAGAQGGKFNSVTRTFSTAGRGEVTPPISDNQQAYFNFDGNADDMVGEYDADAEVDITYVADRFGLQESAAQFNGNTSIIEVPNGVDLLTENWTLSYWVYIDTVDHVDAGGNNAGHFIMGVGAFHGFQIETNGSANMWKMGATYMNDAGTTQPSDFFVDGNGQDATNGGWEGIEFERNVTGGLKTLQARKWAHVVVTYDASENKRSMYMNGQLIERDALSNAGVNFTGLAFSGSNEVGTKLAFGFPFDRSGTMWQNEPWGSYNVPTANHFKGMLDDVRFFDAAMSEADVTSLYNAEKP